MRVPKEWKLSLDNDVFNALKLDFDHVLSRTLDNMQEKSSEYAEVKVTLKIFLNKEEIEEPRVDDFCAEREMIVPRFNHKVTSAIQIKDEASGTLGGNYELVFDAASGGWKIREVIGPQQTLFDEWEPGN